MFAQQSTDPRTWFNVFHSWQKILIHHNSLNLLKVNYPDLGREALMLWFIYFGHWGKREKQSFSGERITERQREMSAKFSVNEVGTNERQKWKLGEGGWKSANVRETEQKGEREMNVCLVGEGGVAAWVQTKDTVPFTNPDQPSRLHRRCGFSHTEEHTVARLVSLQNFSSAR